MVAGLGVEPRSQPYESRRRAASPAIWWTRPDSNRDRNHYEGRARPLSYRSRRINWSGRRESNPLIYLGKVARKSSRTGRMVETSGVEPASPVCKTDSAPAPRPQNEDQMMLSMNGGRWARSTASVRSAVKARSFEAGLSTTAARSAKTVLSGPAARSATTVRSSIKARSTESVRSLISAHSAIRVLSCNTARSELTALSVTSARSTSTDLSIPSARSGFPVLSSHSARQQKTPGGAGGEEVCTGVSDRQTASPPQDVPCSHGMCRFERRAPRSFPEVLTMTTTPGPYASQRPDVNTVASEPPSRYRCLVRR